MRRRYDRFNLILFGRVGFKFVVVSQMQSQAQVAQVNLAHQHLTQLSQSLQNQSCVTPLVNGTVGSGIALVQQNQALQNTSTVPILVR